MASAENLKNNIIEKILTVSNKEYLTALYQLLQNSPNRDKVTLSEEQILVLQLSDKDIEEGRLISQDQMNEEDLRWLKEMKFRPLLAAEGQVLLFGQKDPNPTAASAATKVSAGAWPVQTAPADAE